MGSRIRLGAPLPPAPEHEGPLADFREYLASSRRHLDQVARAIKDNGSPGVLETATITIPASGVFTASNYRVPYAAVSITNLSMAAPLIVTSAGPMGSAPGGGQGQMTVPAGGHIAENMTGQALTIYGPAGGQVVYSVLVNRIQPSTDAPAGVALAYPASSLTANGAVTDPGAGAVIASVSVTAAGLYQADVRAYLSGTIAAGDTDNMEVTATGGTPVVLLLPPVANGPVVAASVRVRAAAAGTVAVTAIAAASGASAVYRASLAVVQVGP